MCECPIKFSATLLCFDAAPPPPPPLKIIFHISPCPCVININSASIRSSRSALAIVVTYLHVHNIISPRHPLLLYLVHFLNHFSSSSSSSCSAFSFSSKWKILLFGLTDRIIANSIRDGANLLLLSKKFGDRQGIIQKTKPLMWLHSIEPIIFPRCQHSTTTAPHSLLSSLSLLSILCGCWGPHSSK